MSFTFHCPYCNSKFEAEDEWVGQDTQCPSCKNDIVICSCEDEDLEEMDNHFKRYPDLSIFQRIKILFESNKLRLGIRLLKREKLSQQERLELEIMYDFQKNDYKNACKLAETYISLFPQSAIGYRWMAEILDDGYDKKDQSLEYSTKAISIDDKYAECYCIRGNTKRWMRPADNEGAIKDYQRAIQIDPHMNQAYSGIGWALQNGDGSTEEALLYFKKAIKYDMYKTNFAPRQGLAEIYCSQGRYDDAIEMANEAIEMAPDSWVMRVSRADILSQCPTLQWEQILKDYAYAIAYIPQVKQFPRHYLRYMNNAMSEYIKRFC